MTSRERILKIFDRKPADRPGFWLGNPADEFKDILCDEFGIDVGNLDKCVDSETALLATKAGLVDMLLAKELGSDFVWLSPEHVSGSWKHPENKPVFDVLDGHERTSLNQSGVLADCCSVEEIEKFAWPDSAYWDFSTTIDNITEIRANELAVFSGMWMPFFHVLCDLFGMDNYFMKMHTCPEVVEAATRRVLDFYLESNKRYLDLAADKMDVLFFGNDLGSQLNLLMSPDMVKKFILPGYKEIVAQAKSYNLKVMLHSCGAISKIIPDIIDIGIDALHPLQAKAQGMDAETLSREYKGDIIFCGGIDTQDLLPFQTSQKVADEVKRVANLLGPNLIISPSHEALLPNVPVENVLAMRDAVFRL